MAVPYLASTGPSDEFDAAGGSDPACGVDSTYPTNHRRLREMRLIDRPRLSIYCGKRVNFVSEIQKTLAITIG
jgi:hypothetical protein